MDIKALCLGLFFIKEFSPVVGVVVLAAILWWGIDPGLLWHTGISPFEGFAHDWFGWDGAWATVGRWGFGLVTLLLGALCLVPLGLIGTGLIFLAFMGILAALALVLYGTTVPIFLLLVLWLSAYSALRQYVLKKSSINHLEDLNRNQWIGLLVLAVSSYGFMAYGLIVRFMP